jgi:uncharacterized membrane protein YtjA (UPF0391 family)
MFFRAEINMLKWALLFALISLVAALVGISGIAAGSATAATLVFSISLALCAVFVILGLAVVDRVT